MLLLKGGDDVTDTSVVASTGYYTASQVSIAMKQSVLMHVFPLHVPFTQATSLTAGRPPCSQASYIPFLPHPAPPPIRRVMPFPPVHPVPQPKPRPSDTTLPPPQTRPRPLAMPSDTTLPPFHSTPPTRPRPLAVPSDTTLPPLHLAPPTAVLSDSTFPHMYQTPPYPPFHGGKLSWLACYVY